MAQQEPTKRLSGMIPVEDHRAFEQLAADNDRTVAAELRIAVREALKNAGRKV